MSDKTNFNRFNNYEPIYRFDSYVDDIYFGAETINTNKQQLNFISKFHKLLNTTIKPEKTVIHKQCFQCRGLSFDLKQQDVKFAESKTKKWINSINKFISLIRRNTIIKLEIFDTLLG